MLVYTLAIESALNVTQSPNDCTDCSFIVYPVLSLNFVIALRLKGDVDSI